ncbi:MAG: VacJ family lipoprotein [Rhodospirillales bacterium]|nr:VacJ family lipoprotein [Rhodospirillales bacterium]
MTQATPASSRNRARGAAMLASGLLMACATSLTGCARVPTDPEARVEFDQTDDPAEPTNRAIFAANQAVDRNALQPVARAYSDNVPRVARNRIHNFVENLEQPGVAVNDLLQGNLSRAWTTTERFAINTTVGGAGLFDAATDWDRPAHKADFGQTLGVWGAGPGPAVQLPLFGPSNVRDSVGKVAGLVLNPTTAIPGGAFSGIEIASGGLGVVDGRAELLPTTDAMEKSSLDYYATLRSVRAQQRTAFVEEGRLGKSRAQSEREQRSAEREQKPAPVTVEMAR